jgi:hypothetical protein
MPHVDPDQIELLRQARDRAAKLVEDIRRQRDELLVNVPTIDPASLAEGRAAMDNAVASAERMLAAVESALAEVDTRNPE